MADLTEAPPRPVSAPAGAAAAQPAAPRAAERPAAARSPYAGQVITRTPPWKALTVWDIFFNNMSLGLFLAAALGAALAPAAFGWLTRVAYPLALALLVVDLGLLIFDLGDPLRFHHMLRVFKPSSPMSFGTWSLTGYGILLGIASAGAVLQWPILAGLRAWVPLLPLVEAAAGIAGLLAVIPALGGILYKGVLFSVTSQPGWRDARWLGGYLGNAALLLGSTMLLVLAGIFGQGEARTALQYALLALLALDVVLFSLLYRGIAPAFSARYDIAQKLFFWLTLVGMGWIGPLALLLPGSQGVLTAPPLLLAAALAVLYAVVYLPHAPPRE
jgi:hypothetical protein